LRPPPQVFVGAGFFETFSDVLVVVGLCFVMLGGFGLVRIRRGPI
jgi:hypothetical protein